MSIGFNFDDLDTHGITYDGNKNASRRPCLNIAVHPLWHQKNFRRGVMLDEIDYLPIFGEVGWDDPAGIFPDELYRRILPALQLATILLDRARPFFMKVMFADIRSGPRGRVFAHDYSPIPAQSSKYDALLLHVAPSYRIFTEGTLQNNENSIFGVTRATPDPSFPVLGALAPEFFAAFHSPVYESQTPQAISATCLVLGMTCVHELAHAILMHRQFAENLPLLNAGQQLDPEPLFTLTDPVVELGEALEHFLFGATLHLLGNSDDGAMDATAELGLGWAPWVTPDPATHETCLSTDAEPVIWAISASSIGRLFDAGSWTLSRQTHPNIELTPARALSVTVEGCEGDIYDTLFLARLLTVRKSVSRPPVDQRQGRSGEPNVRRSRSPRSGRSASPRSRRQISPGSRRRG